MLEEDFGVSHPCADLSPSQVTHSSAPHPRGWARTPPNNPHIPRRARGASLGGIATRLPAGYSHKGCTDDSSYTEDCVAIHQQLADVKGAGGLNNLPQDPGCFSNWESERPRWGFAINSPLG